MKSPERGRTLALTTIALLAFTANSVLARIALREGAADAAGFTAVRLISGAAVLVLLVWWGPRFGRSGGEGGTGPRRERGPGGSWAGAAALFLSVAPFSFAYIHLTTAAGALIRFGFVQVTMTLWALVIGERPSALQWLGMGSAAGGLAYLMLPGLEAPPLGAGVLMGIAGVSWAAYSLLGKEAIDPLNQTAGNFVRAVPLAVVLVVVRFSELHLEPAGALLAVASGALASGAGYAVWYAALPGLTATNAATVQLAVPVLAAVAGVLMLSEAVSLRLGIASVFVLGGIAMAIAGRPRPGTTDTTEPELPGPGGGSPERAPPSGRITRPPGR